MATLLKFSLPIVSLPMIAIQLGKVPYDSAGPIVYFLLSNFSGFHIEKFTMRVVDDASVKVRMFHEENMARSNMCVVIL